MQFQYKLTIGNDEFTLVDVAETPTDFFKKVEFYAK